jgi:hypothetical protein
VVSSKKQSSAKPGSQQQRSNSRKGSNAQQATANKKDAKSSTGANGSDSARGNAAKASAKGGAGRGNTAPPGQKKQSSAQKRLSTRERVAEQRAVERRRERRRWIITFGATGAVVVALGAGAAWAIESNNKKQQKAADRSASAQPPWALPADPIKGANAAGLAIASSEKLTQHIHAHVDVYVNGQKQTVPANLGIATDGSQLAEMHTHDNTGVIHIESPSKTKKFTLGEVFTEWNVKLTPTQLGGLKADATHPLTVYLNGKPQTGDPTTVQLAAHAEVAVVYGAKNSVKVPSSYTFAQGL